MPRFMEFEDKELDKAIKQACDKLNIPKQKLKYDVISYGSTGIFGLVGVKKARIRVSVPDKASVKTKPAPAKEEKSVPVETEPILKGQKKPEEKDAAAAPEKEEAPVIETPADAAPAPAETRTEEAREKKPPAVEAQEEKEENEEEEEEEEEESNIDFSLEEPAELGAEALDKIVNFITSDAAVEKEIRGEKICYKVEGGNPAILIGKRGQTLEAIQYLVGKIVNKKHDRRIRIQVDVEGYLNNKRSNLMSLAERLAQKAKQTGKPVSVSQMNAHDRRIIHLALKNNSGVKTQSVGDGFYRKLVIFPKKKGGAARKPNKPSAAGKMAGEVKDKSPV